MSINYLCQPEFQRIRELKLCPVISPGLFYNLREVIPCFLVIECQIFLQEVHTSRPTADLQFLAQEV